MTTSENDETPPPHFREQRYLQASRKIFEMCTDGKILLKLKSICFTTKMLHLPHQEIKDGLGGEKRKVRYNVTDFSKGSFYERLVEMRRVELLSDKPPLGVLHV